MLGERDASLVARYHVGLPFVLDPPRPAQIAAAKLGMSLEADGERERRGGAAREKPRPACLTTLIVPLCHPGPSRGSPIGKLSLTILP
jgi:hypothetical protein